MTAPEREFTAIDRRALQSVGTQFWVNGVVFASFVPRFPEIRDRIEVGLGQLGLLLTLGTVGGLLGSLICGRVIERLGTRTTTVFGACGLITALPVIGLANGPVVFLIGLVMMHFFDVLTDVGMNMQGSWLSARRHAPVMNRLHGLWSLGTVVGGLVAARLAGSVDLRTHLFIVAAVLFATVLFVAPGLLKVDELRDDQQASSSSAGQSRIGGFALLVAIMGAGAIIVEFITTDWAALRLVEDLDSSESLAALGFVAFTSAMVISRFSGDSITMRLGAARHTRLSIVVAAIGMALANLVPNVAVSMLGLFIAGLGVAVLFPSLYNEAAQAPGRPGVALGAMTAGSRIGTLATPIVVGYLAGLQAFSVGQAVAVVTLPAAALVFFVREYKLVIR